MDSLYTTTYIGNKPGAEDIYTHAETIDKAIVIESAVLAGPVNIFTETVTVTGTLVIV
jgi:hypothetical protein